jgi:REP element-mobilizing transposase RayT
MPFKHERRKNRLLGFDYSQNGYYFVTICVKDREKFFGFVEGGKMILNEFGKIADQCWLDIPNHFQWQKSFHDHIIRNEKSLYAIRRYIRDNPKNLSS